MHTAPERAAEETPRGKPPQGTEGKGAAAPERTSAEIAESMSGSAKAVALTNSRPAERTRSTKGQDNEAGTSSHDVEPPQDARPEGQSVAAAGTRKKSHRAGESTATRDNPESPPTQLMLAEAEFRQDVKKRRLERDTIDRLLEADEQERLRLIKKVADLEERMIGRIQRRDKLSEELEAAEAAYAEYAETTAAYLTSLLKRKKE